MTFTDWPQPYCREGGLACYHSRLGGC